MVGERRDNLFGSGHGSSSERAGGRISTHPDMGRVLIRVRNVSGALLH